MTRSCSLKWHSFSAVWTSTIFLCALARFVEIMHFTDKQVAKELRGRGISADYYHADMDVVAREKVHMRCVDNFYSFFLWAEIFSLMMDFLLLSFQIDHMLITTLVCTLDVLGYVRRILFINFIAVSLHEQNEFPCITLNSSHIMLIVIVLQKLMSFIPILDPYN